MNKSFSVDVVDGLRAPRKTLPCKWLYDALGSALFQDITGLPEYYPTRTEFSLLNEHADSLLAGLPDRLSFVELGAGSADKALILLKAALESEREQVTYSPVDISSAALDELASQVASHPAVEMEPLVADFTADLSFLLNQGKGAKVVLFLGSTIGNMNPEDIPPFLQSIAAHLDPQDRFILGLDLEKDIRVLEAAYNDAAGVTAQFNLNLLVRINRELGGHFDLDRFKHVALFNCEASRIEMHLESLEDQEVWIEGPDVQIKFQKGETIHTENSYKFSLPRLSSVFEAVNLKVDQIHVHPEFPFALVRLALAS